MNLITRKCVSTALLMSVVLFVQACAIGPAPLPDAQEVPATEAQGLDGVWMISGINKRLRFDSGRAVVMDGWNHWGLAVNQGMVALINVREAGPGMLTADDLVNGGSAWSGVLTPSGRMNVTVQTEPLPINYALIPVTMDYPEYVNESLASIAGAQSHEPQAVQTPTPLPIQPVAQPLAPASDNDFAPERDDAQPAMADPFADCVELVVDPATNQQVCLD